MTSASDMRGVLTAGPPLKEASACAILIHGRGATAGSILTLAGTLDVDNVCYLAPQAPGNTWYPYSFLEPLELNRDGIEAGMETLENLLERVEHSGIGVERTALIGFSQGACLSLEFAARHPRRYGAIAGLAGGLIGPPGTLMDYGGSLEGTPVFLGCGDPDPHIPRLRVEETAATLRGMNARVEVRFYNGLGHAVNDKEVGIVRGMLSELTG